jgi:hypothetical protein
MDVQYAARRIVGVHIGARKRSNRITVHGSRHCIDGAERVENSPRAVSCQRMNALSALRLSA